MIEYITVCALCWTGAGTIIYFAVKAEEFVMKRLTGEGAIESAYRILKEILKRK